MKWFSSVESKLGYPMGAPARAGKKMIELTESE